MMALLHQLRFVKTLASCKGIRGHIHMLKENEMEKRAKNDMSEEIENGCSKDENCSETWHGGDTLFQRSKFCPTRLKMLFTYSQDSTILQTRQKIHSKLAFSQC